MKSIPNKKGEVILKAPNGVSVPVEKTFAMLITECMNTMPTDKQGNQIAFTVTEMRDRIRIVDACAKGTKNIELEDSDVQKLKGCFKDMSWIALSKHIVELHDVIEKL